MLTNHFCKILNHDLINGLNSDDDQDLLQIIEFLDTFSKKCRINTDLFIRFIRTFNKVRTRTNQWDENTITANLIDDILNHYSSKKSSEFNINVFKLNGTCEHKFGDIAFIIRSKMNNGTVIEGVAFIESKRDYEPDKTYESLNLQQLENFLNNTSHSFYCFYSSSNFFPILHSNYLYHKINNSKTPANKQIDETLFSNLETFSFIDQIERFVNSYDLDYTQNAINIATGFEARKGCPEYIITLEKQSEFPEPTPSYVNLKKYSAYNPHNQSEHEQHNIEDNHDEFYNADDAYITNDQAEEESIFEGHNDEKNHDDDDDIDMPLVFNN